MLPAKSRDTFTGGPMVLFGSLFSASPDWLVKLVEEGGRTNLTLISLVIVVIGAIAYIFFRKEATWVKVITWLLMFGGAVFLVAVLVTPAKSNEHTNDGGGTVQKAVILTELTEAYTATGQQLAVFDDWGQAQSRATLHMNQNFLTGIVKGYQVSMSIDPHQLPTPQYYNANSGQISTLGSKEAPYVVKFFSSYEQYRAALVNLTSNPTDFNGAFISVTVSAREAVTRGRAALCAMGSTPPVLFPGGGFAEPVAPDCSSIPFSR
jgi:hypothetical protein